MNKVKIVSISLLFVAGLASGCSKSTQIKRNELTAQKEDLINKLADKVVAGIEAAYLDEKESGIPWGMDDLPSRDQSVKSTRLFFSGLCGIAERKEVEDRDLLEYVDRYIEIKEKNDQAKLVVRLCIGVITGDSDSSGSALEAKFFAEVPQPLAGPLRSIVEDTRTLFRVMKEIRQLT